MEKIIKKTGLASIISSILFAIIAIIIICNPKISFKIITYILGSVFIAIGLIKIVNYFIAKGNSNLYNYEFMHGLIAIMTGTVIVIFSSALVSIFRIIIGIWIIYNGITRLGLSFRLKATNIKMWIFLLMLSLAIILCGIYILSSPDILMVTCGIMMLIYSIIDLIDSIVFIRSAREILK